MHYNKNRSPEQYANTPNLWRLAALAGLTLAEGGLLQKERGGMRHE